MQAMGHRKLIVMGPDAILDEWIYVHVTDIDLALVVVDEIDFFFVVNCLGLVNFNNLLLFEEATGVLRTVLTSMQELLATSLTELETLGVLIDLFQEVLFIIDYSLFAFQVVYKLMVVVSVA